MVEILSDVLYITLSKSTLAVIQKQSTAQCRYKHDVNIQIRDADFQALVKHITHNYSPWQGTKLVLQALVNKMQDVNLG